MKKILLAILLLPMFASAQSLIGGKNIVRWNLGSLALRNYHFTYERSITRMFSLSLSYRTMPKGSVPFQSQLENAIKSKEINFGKMEMGNTAWTVAGRVYFGLGRMKGFYIEPYLRFANFDISAPVKYTITSGPATGQSKEALFNGKVKSTSPGLLLGWQFQLATKLVLDVQILGGHYGHSNGDLNFAATLTNDERDALQKSINDIKADPFKIQGTVSNSGAVIKTDGPWAGLRGANIGIGFRF
ncbi:hypothetical protein [Sediminibacterium soli]|uniref:hypothetical protein n=1 Tax=Sediminibacterium soli TaxID=2698829 RepID=UPI00137B1FF9|nr:hypothetical protein [Sediminibacterium soli]NCI47002.1 hypothetical protein [Sediminibacterium soli]